MSNKQDAKILMKGKKQVEKAILLHKKIQVRKDFNAQVSCFVPRAEKNKPCPSLAITFDIAYDNIKLVCPDVDSANEVFYQIITTIETWRESIEKELISERERWIKLQTEYITELNTHKSNKIIDFSTGEVLRKVD